MKSSPPLVDAAGAALLPEPISEVMLMPDESTATEVRLESKRCDALDAAEIGARLNDAACGLDEPSAEVSETQSATEQDAKNGSSASATVASPPAPVDDVVADEQADPPTPDEASAEVSQPAEPSQADAVTAVETATEAVEAFPDQRSASVGDVPWDAQPSSAPPSADDTTAPAPSADTAAPEVPCVPREPEDRWAIATPNAGEAAGTSEMPSSEPERRWSVVVRFLGSTLAVLDRPFARLAPWTKDLIGYAAVATFVMAIAVWALVILLT